MDNNAKIAYLRRRLCNEEINALPLCHYGGEVRLIRSMDDLDRAMPDLTTEGVLGFDTETRPSFHKGKSNSPSLIQLATTLAVYLIQLNFLPFSRSLTKILDNPRQIKAGVAIHDDMKELAALHNFEIVGLVDLGILASSHKLPTQGLRTLAANIFGRRISKSSRCSNWGLAELSHRQILYAATDAWMGRLIFLRMRELGLAPDITRDTAREGNPISVLDILADQEEQSTPNT
ncbi:MAG: 3'-5' exonuclease domain-containing protein 2 [Desulfovibrio sp.]|jgi:ribonuclease D|nr:3'-5' exonuclease domain-containing protein 2 [Desulfovibrio sp.]